VLSLGLSTLFAVLSAGNWTTIASELPVPGASGDVLTATGTAAGDYDWAAPVSSSSQLAVAQFTASGSWTVPAGVTAVEVVLIGGGGAGAGFTGDIYGGTGGGAGQITYSVVATTPGDTLTIDIGSGGPADSGGEAGSASTCTGATTANGGAGGLSAPASVDVPGGTGGGYGGGQGGNGTSELPAAGSSPGAGGGGGYMGSTQAGAAGADGYCEIRYIVG